MPCYDKKLEAVRPEFTFEESKNPVKEIDTVLATHELLDLFKLKDIKLDQVKPWQPEPVSHSPDLLASLLTLSQNPGYFSVQTLESRSSNGYLEYVFRRAASDMFKVQIDPTQKLVYTQGKNRHY